ncbi:MAG: hypothetical protein BWY32_03699 [bacterium ADurb.Bin243]|nr:MAG: hypothetical protein BWY32_03699 [bacterium ADurb.Bin243]
MNTLSNNILEGNNVLKSQFSYDMYTAREKEIVNFLASKNVQVIRQHEQLNNLEPAVKDLAMFMGDNFKNIKRIYDLMKLNLSPVRTFSISIENLTRQEREMSMAFAVKLQNAKAISSYRLSCDKKNLIIAPVKSFTTCNFLTGHWFEYYIREKILAAVNSSVPGLDFACLSNLSIKLASGKYAEIDMMMRINGEYFLIEAKSGKLNIGIGQFYRLLNGLRIKTRNAFILMNEGAEQVINTCRNSLAFKVVNFERFISNFCDYLDKVALMSATARKSAFIPA